MSEQIIKKNNFNVRHRNVNRVEFEQQLKDNNISFEKNSFNKVGKFVDYLILDEDGNIVEEINLAGSSFIERQNRIQKALKEKREKEPLPEIKNMEKWLSLVSQRKEKEKNNLNSNIQIENIEQGKINKENVQVEQVKTLNNTNKIENVKLLSNNKQMTKLLTKDSFNEDFIKELKEKTKKVKE